MPGASLFFSSPEFHLPQNLIDLRLHNPDFSIVEDTNDFIVIDKPAHLLVYPNGPGGPSTLFDELQNLLLFELTNGGQISIITRLDRETSGLVLTAKTKAAASRFAKAMQNREFTKTYLALVWGWPEVDEFENDQPILPQRNIRESKIWVKQIVHPDGKPSHSRFQVRDRFERKGEPFSLIECSPKTGRLHQIRVHLAAAGFPVVGDKIYGPDENCYLDFIEQGWTSQLQKKLLLNRHALHAWKLSWKNHEWETKLPGEFFTADEG